MKHKELQKACDVLSAQINKNNEKKEVGTPKWFGLGVFGKITVEQVIIRRFFTTAMQSAKTALDDLIAQEKAGTEIEIKAVKTIINHLNTTLHTTEIVTDDRIIEIRVNAHRSWKPIFEALRLLSAMQEIRELDDYERRSAYESGGMQLKNMSPH